MRLFISLAAFLLSANIAAADTQQDDAVASLTTLNDQFNAAVVALDAETLVNFYSDDTLWIAQGKPASQGLKGPSDMFEFVTSNKGKVSHTIDHLFVAEDASLAVMIGTFEALIETVDIDAVGTYLYVLRPGDDGWEVITDMWYHHTSE